MMVDGIGQLMPLDGCDEDKGLGGTGVVLVLVIFFLSFVSNYFGMNHIFKDPIYDHLLSLST